MIVGPDELHATVNKSLLCENSEYFKRAFSSGFKEAKDRTIRMPEDKVEVVDIFLEWLLQESTSDWIRESTTEQALRTNSDMAADFVCAINDIREHDENWHPFDDNNAGDYY